MSDQTPQAQARLLAENCTHVSQMVDDQSTWLVCQKCVARALAAQRAAGRQEAFREAAQLARAISDDTVAEALAERCDQHAAQEVGDV